MEGDWPLTATWETLVETDHPAGTRPKRTVADDLIQLATRACLPEMPIVNLVPLADS